MIHFRQLAIRLIAVLVGILVPLSVAEVGLRFLPFNEGLIAPAINDDQPLYHFLPDRDFRYSQDWDMKNGRIRHANNLGFMSDIDYEPGSGRPLLAVIGDSFIEAVHVDWGETAQGRLYQKLSPAIDVYSFGAAYAALGQYLAWADYVRREFAPTMLVANIVGNDYDLPRAGDEGGFSLGFSGMTTFIEDAAGNVVLKRTDRPAEPVWKRLLRHSALVSYLYRNLAITALPERIEMWWRAQGSTETSTAFVANTEAAADPERVARAKRHVDRFLDLLPEKSGLPPARILLIVDGLRTQIYDAAELASVQNSFPAVMNRYLAAEGTRRGFEVRDLTPLMVERHRRDGQRFEFPFNGHWNANGHDVMAEAVLTSQTFGHAFPGVEGASGR